ncbi:S-layer protein [Halosimplex sp. TS25]|uniref:S-layer protein n=1 Tax=Halosimplex rarum TaxID=3396619 RepID=UPI0039EAE2B4
MPVLWDDEAVKDYLTPESHQKSREQFLETHIDIDKIRADYLFPHQGNDEFVTQAEFRDAILKSEVDDDNRIFILRGETGSGKSQLCQWLEYQIGTETDTGVSDTHVALHVSRNKTSISDILEIISGPIDEDVDIKNIDELDPEPVAEAIIKVLQAFEGGTSAFTETELEELTAIRPKGTDLRSILIKNIRSHQKGVVDDTETFEPDLISERDYRDLSLEAFGKAKGGDTLFPALRGRVHSIFSQNLGVEDFQGKLEEFSQKYEDRGLRPVLICEDLTTFSVLKEQLLDHIFQLDSGHYDVVLGWTTGWEKDDLGRALSTSNDTYTYMQDRAEGYLSTTDDRGRAYFLDDDVTVELARKYMSAIIDNSSGDSDVDIDHEAFDGLYPFNGQFIRRSYEQLVQEGNERRTPRLLLIRVIKECLNATVPPYEANENNPYIEPFPTSVDMTYGEEIQNLVKWYGSTSADSRLRVRENILETFDVSKSSAVIRDNWAHFTGTVTTPPISLSLVGGTLRPGEEITIEATIDNQLESGVQVNSETNSLGKTDGQGRLDVTLPEEEQTITLTAEKDESSSQLELDISRGTLQLTPNPTKPEIGEEVEFTARMDGTPEEDVMIYSGDSQLGSTNAEGKFFDNAPQEDSVIYRAKKGSTETEIELDIEDSGGPVVVLPVDTNLEPEEVQQRLLEYQNWITSGEKYPSSKTLRDGAAGILEEWHEPTLLGNHNASNDGVKGIWYTRGSNIPVSLPGVDDRKGISFELPFGPDHDNLYRPLFWYGISSDGEFPQEDKYNINYDLLREWADGQVTDFRQTMREEIEECLPKEMSIEDLIVLTQFLIHNLATGKRELSKDVVLSEAPNKSDRDFKPPLVRAENHDSTVVENSKALLNLREDSFELAEGFFFIKKNVIDYELLSDSISSVQANLDDYLEKAMLIETSGLPEAYHINTTRSTGQSLKKFLVAVSDYATQLNQLTGSENAEHVIDEITDIREIYEPGHTTESLSEFVDRLDCAIGRMKVSKYTNWKKAKTKLDSGGEFDIEQFRADMATFSDVESKRSHELVATLHDFERSRNEREEWSVYNSIVQMINEAEDKELPEGGSFPDRIERTDEMDRYEKERDSIDSVLVGDR